MSITVTKAEPIVLVYGQSSHCIFLQFFKSDIFNFMSFCNICCKNIIFINRQLLAKNIYWFQDIKSILNVTDP